jgi:hypothetical protein
MHVVTPPANQNAAVCGGELPSQARRAYATLGYATLSQALSDRRGASAGRRSTYTRQARDGREPGARQAWGRCAAGARQRRSKRLQTRGKRGFWLGVSRLLARRF